MLAPALTAILAWTLVEYVIHRWLGHDRRFTRNAFGGEHVAHHARGDHFAPTWKKVAFLGLAAAVVLPPSVLVAGLADGLVFGLTFIASWLVYEVIHRRMHTSGGVGPYARWIRRHHFHHHFHDPKKNFGVSSPLWDVILGTRTAPSRVGPIVVPRRQAMRWLLDPDGRVRARHARDYTLRPDRQAA